MPGPVWPVGRAGVRTSDQWRGFAEVGAVAARLNRIVTDALLQAGLPVVTFQPSASILCEDGKIVEMAVEPIHRAAEAGIVPLVYGDVAFDRARGGTIISTEDIFRFLARTLPPARILLAGIESGVYSDWPDGRTVIPAITSVNAPRYFPGIGASRAPDVTGGMAAKVSEMLGLAAEIPGLEILIFSGETPGNTFSALTRPHLSFGTIITDHQSPNL